jgi:transcriptional regulator with XRE-family HTH domain
MKFGRTVRKLREEKHISIAQFAKRVGMSPTYLAPIEREVFPPPAEAKVVRIARALDQDPDEFLALAGRIRNDLMRIIRRQPRQAAKLLRAIDGLSGNDIEDLVETAHQRRCSRLGGGERSN